MEKKENYIVLNLYSFSIEVGKIKESIELYRVLVTKFPLSEIIIDLG